MAEVKDSVPETPNPVVPRRDRVKDALLEIRPGPRGQLDKIFEKAIGHVIYQLIEMKEKPELSAAFFEWQIDSFVWHVRSLEPIPLFPFPPPEKYEGEHCRPFRNVWMQSNINELFAKQHERNTIVCPANVPDLLDVREQIWEKNFPNHSSSGHPFELLVPSKTDFCSYVATSRQELAKVMSSVAELISNGEFLVIGRVAAKCSLVLTFDVSVDTERRGVQSRFFRVWADLCNWHSELLMGRGVKLDDFLTHKYTALLAEDFVGLPAQNTLANECWVKNTTKRVINEISKLESSDELVAQRFEQLQKMRAEQLAHAMGKEVLEQLSGTNEQQYRDVKGFVENPLFHRLTRMALVRHVWGPVYHYAPEYIASFVQDAFSTGPYNRGQLELVCSDLGRIILGKEDMLFSLVYNPHALLVVCVKALEAKGRAIRVKGKPLDQWIHGYKKIVGRWRNDFHISINLENDRPIDLASLRFDFDE